MPLQVAPNRNNNIVVSRRLLLRLVDDLGEPLEEERCEFEWSDGTKVELVSDAIGRIEHVWDPARGGPVKVRFLDRETET